MNVTPSHSDSGNTPYGHQSGTGNPVPNAHCATGGAPTRPVLNPAMKAAFIAQHRETYTKKIGACMLDAEAAQTMTLEFFSYGIRAGLNISECIDLLASGSNPILLAPAFRLRPAQTSDLINFIKQIDPREIYALAGTSPLRDYSETPATGQWTPRPEHG